MKKQKLMKLIDEMADLIRFHELEAIDSQAVNLLAQVQEAKQCASTEGAISDEYLEEIAFENTHSMVG